MLACFRLGKAKIRDKVDRKVPHCHSDRQLTFALCSRKLPRIAYIYKKINYLKWLRVW